MAQSIGKYVAVQTILIFLHPLLDIHALMKNPNHENPIIDNLIHYLVRTVIVFQTALE